MISVVATLVSGALLWAAFPPIDAGVLAFVAPFPFLWALRRADRLGQAAWLGFLFGGVFFGALLRWIVLLGWVAWIPLTTVLALHGAAYGSVVWLARNHPAHRWWGVTVGTWALWEFVRARFPFGGFPWGTVGNAVGALAWPRGAAQWIGTTGWSVMAIGVAAALVIAFEDYRARRILVGVLAGVLGLSILGAILPPRADGPAFRIAIVQGSSPCPRRHCDNEAQLIYESHLELTRTLAPGQLDLVVWPENSTGTPVEPLGNPSVFASISAEARRIGSYMLVSGTRHAADPNRFINANLLFSRRGDLIGEYRKRQPVPYGEYVPFRDQLTFISQLDAVPRDMERGTQPVVFDLPEGVLGSVISFEGAFDRTVRSEVKAGARLLVIASNEGSFGRTEASDQFIGLTRMRAAELGTPIAHAAITGRSTLIEADGSHGRTTGLFLKEVIGGDLHWRTAGPTLYARVGDWLQMIAIVVGVLALAWPRRHRDSNLFVPPWARPAERSPLVRQ